MEQLAVMSSYALEGARSIASFLGLRSGTPLLPFVPKPIKLLVLVLIILNSPSFPLLWHIRSLSWPYRSYLSAKFKGKRRWLDDWDAQNASRGRITQLRTRMSRWAWVDDCDFNMHLSNSCYAKSGDAARFKFAGESLAPVFHAGAHCALGASHYTFIREIPIGSRYVMESRAVGWGEKWFYVVTEYIIYPKRSSNPSLKVENVKSSLVTALPYQEGITGMTLSASPSGTTTPATHSGTATPPTSTTPSTIEDVKTSVAASVRARAPREDGGVVCCFSVFEYCFKVGRVTVPPRIAMYISLQTSSPAARDHARSLILSKDGGRAWLRGGWKDEPNAYDLGRDVGLEGDRELGLAMADAGVSWVEKGTRGMEVVARGLASL